MCGEGWGFGLPLNGGVVLGGGRAHTQALRTQGRKPYNVARAPVLINLNLYFKPYTQPKPRLNAGSKPEAEHHPSTLTPNPPEALVDSKPYIF